MREIDFTPISCSKQNGSTPLCQARRVTTHELQQFIVANVRTTGRELGAEAYGSVVEVEIPGTSVAAKKLHDGLVQFGSEQQVCICVLFTRII